MRPADAPSRPGQTDPSAAQDPIRPLHCRQLTEAAAAGQLTYPRRTALSLSAEDALAAVMKVANSHKQRMGCLPTRLRIGADISSALLRDGLTQGRILLYPGDPDCWVLLVADSELVGPTVVIDPPPTDISHSTL
jgi:hypothetical protein